MMCDDKSAAIVVCGVAGSGKSTIASAVALRRGWVYADADDFHSAENVRLMAAGVSMTDERREPWLGRVRNHIEETARDGRTVVVACSALKRRHRELLVTAGVPVFFVQLDGSPDVIGNRLESRAGHFAQLTLAESQFAALQPLEPGEWGARVDVEAPLHDVVRRVLFLVDEFRAKRAEGRDRFDI